MCCILIFLLVKNVSFSQSIRETIYHQLDKIALLKLEGKKFVISVFLDNQVYILQRDSDSLSVISYATGDSLIGSVYSINVSRGVYRDTLFTNTVDSVYDDVRQKHSYLVYSKEVLNNGNFLLTFWDENKLQVFSRKEASLNQKVQIKKIVDCLNLYSFTPFKGVKKQWKRLTIKDWNELLKYLKDGTIDNLPK